MLIFPRKNIRMWKTFGIILVMYKRGYTSGKSINIFFPPFPFKKVCGHIYFKFCFLSNRLAVVRSDENSNIYSQTSFIRTPFIQKFTIRTVECENKYYMLHIKVIRLSGYSPSGIAIRINDV